MSAQNRTSLPRRGERQIAPTDLGLARYRVEPPCGPEMQQFPIKPGHQTDHASSRLIARSATASNTGCTSTANWR